MRYSGSLSDLIRMAANYISARIAGESTIDPSDTPIDRQRRIIGLVLFIVFIVMPALLLLLAMYFPALFVRWFG
jgi:uncharacterized membrane protein